MKRRSILALAVLAMVALVAGALAWDSVRAAAGHREQIRQADDDLKKHEQRLITLLRGSPQLSPETETAIAAHESAQDPVARHEAYDEVVASFRKTMLGDIDATNPLERKFTDDVAGAINRRDVARDPYDVARAEYHAFLHSLRGQIARRISSPTKEDYAAAIASTK